jgi:hypothetical protein
MPTQDDQFSIRRFNLLDGQEVRIYCKLVKVRTVMAMSFNLYEDDSGLKWLEITANGQSRLLPLSHETFEQRVAAELLTLGFNKYSG